MKTQYTTMLKKSKKGMPVISVCSILSFYCHFNNSVSVEIVEVGLSLFSYFCIPGYICKIFIKEHALTGNKCSEVRQALTFL